MPISLSAAEAGTYALAKACSRLLGARQLALDLGFGRRGKLDLEIGTDSSSAIGLAGRRRCGRIRHLETGCLWIQAALHHGRLAVIEVAGKSNTADMMAKGLDGLDTTKSLQP